MHRPCCEIPSLMHAKTKHAPNISFAFGEGLDSSMKQECPSFKGSCAHMIPKVPFIPRFVLMHGARHRAGLLTIPSLMKPGFITVACPPMYRSALGFPTRSALRYLRWEDNLSGAIAPEPTMCSRLFLDFSFFILQITPRESTVKREL